MAATSMKELASEAAVDARESGLYNKDFWSWTQEQAGALRRRDFGAVDWNNVVEEIEALGRSEERAWASCCKNVVSHLLKIHYAPSSPDLNHWRKEIEDWRGEMYRKLADNPGMKGELSEMLAKAWKDGRREAVRKLAEQRSPEDAAHERHLRRGWESRVPVDCPYALQ